MLTYVGTLHTCRRLSLNETATAFQADLVVFCKKTYCNGGPYRPLHDGGVGAGSQPMFLCPKVEVAVARMNTFQLNHSTTMANHSCPGHIDVWRFCNNDFIFVMSTCRFFIRPGRGQGARSLAILVSSLRRAAPQRPVAKQHGGMPSPRAQNLRVYWLARQIEDCRSAQAADI